MTLTQPQMHKCGLYNRAVTCITHSLEAIGRQIFITDFKHQQPTISNNDVLTAMQKLNLYRRFTSEKPKLFDLKVYDVSSR